jgi:hypothetical protein
MTEGSIDLARRGLIEHYREQEAVEWITAVGTSMLPAIQEGDSLLVDFRDPRPRFGQVALFRAGGQFVSHRVVGHGPGTLITKGDNAQRLDPPLRQQEILGVVAAARRGDDGPLVSAGFSGGRGAVIALLSAGSVRALDLALRLPSPVRHPLSRPARALERATRLIVGRLPS